MLCQICNKDKLSKEFIPCAMTTECQHPPLICLRCATAGGGAGKCPYPHCSQPVTPDCAAMNEYRALLHCLFTEVYPTSDPGPVADTASSAQTLNVVMLTGERTVLPFNASATVLSLKSKIQNTLKVAIAKQRLLYEDNEMTDMISGKQANLKDFGVEANSSIILMVLLYAIPSNLNHVTFDLFWGYPNGRRDYLDASCFVYNGVNNEAIVDYNKTAYPRNTHPLSIRHSGDVMDNRNRIGHHTIQVYLQNVPTNVTHLFFTLSAWRCPTISHFPNPSLRFFDAANPSKDLCSTTFRHARNSQAVVMCSVSRAGGGWSIFESGQLSAGNAMCYQPLIRTTQTLIKQGV